MNNRDNINTALNVIDTALGFIFKVFNLLSGLLIIIIGFTVSAVASIFRDTDINNKLEVAAKKERAKRERKWKRDIGKVSAYIMNPIPSVLYCEKYNINNEKLDEYVGKGMLKGYSMGNELYVEDLNIDQHQK